MAFLDDLKKAANSALEKGKEAVEVTKLNAQISGEKDKIKDLYVKIGEQVYANSKNGIDSGFGEFTAQISEIEAKIEEIKAKVLEIKDAGKCPQCGTEVAKDVAFCPKCGNKMN